MFSHSFLAISAFALVQPSLAAVVQQRDLRDPSTIGTSGGWEYRGCYTDDPSYRALQGFSQNSGSMTIETCQRFCYSQHYTLAGLEYGSECYCGFNLDGYSVQKGNSECQYACAGDSTEPCGGAARLTLYHNRYNQQPQTPSSAGGGNAGQWQLAGCYEDCPAGTALTHQTQISQGSGMTPEYCVQACNNAGYSVAGLEGGGTCYCDNRIQGAVKQATGGCDSACYGDNFQLCGGKERVSVYYKPGSAPGSAPATPSGWNALGCYTDSVSGRTLSNQVSVSGGLTVENCLSACKSSGYSYGGVEYGKECFCGNSIQNNSTQADASTCNYSCEGNASETCGGAARINLYQSS